MNLCPKCNNILSSTSISKQNGGSDDREKLYQKILDNEEIDQDEYRGISISTIADEPAFQALDPSDKKKVRMFFKNNIPDDDLSSAIFICNTCKYQENILPGTVIYSRTYTIKNQTLNIDPDVYIDDLTHLRTSSYICPNNKCTASHEMTKKVDRKAVIVIDSEQHVTYICTLCKTMFN